MEGFQDRAGILRLDNDTMFNDFALRLLDDQLQNNRIYSEFFGLLNAERSRITTWRDIPCLPIEVFRKQMVIRTGTIPEFTFRSSGTTDAEKSQHHVASLAWYDDVSEEAFHRVYGDSAGWSFLALLPSYSERPDSSLIHMIRNFIRRSGHEDHGFYLNEYMRLREDLVRFSRNRKVMIIGVTFALLEMARNSPGALENAVVMETGGMKGRGPELTRMEVHQILTKAFHLKHIHSEYGMTELLSQAYSTGRGIFRNPPWMRVFAREIADPLASADYGVTGGLNVFDLANVDSCPFIATSDLGRVHADGSFEVLGRYDHAEARGCNLMLSQIG